MPDQHDLFRIRGASDLTEMLGEAVDTLVPFGPTAMRELPGPDRVAEQIEQVGLLLGAFERGAEQRDEQRGGCEDAERSGQAGPIQPLLEQPGDARRA